MLSLTSVFSPEHEADKIIINLSIDGTSQELKLFDSFNYQSSSYQWN